MRLRLSQSHLAGVGAGVELGKKERNIEIKKVVKIQRKKKEGKLRNE